MMSRLPVPTKELSRHEAPAGDCPHVKQPLTGCYCRNLTTATIPLVIYYCRDSYVHCPIYRTEHDAR